jgi:molybdopterin converting factor subunit 1
LCDRCRSGPMPGLKRRVTSILIGVTSTPQICVRVRLFASYREAAGTRLLDAPLPAGARVADLVAMIAARVPGLPRVPGLVAVNHSYVQADFELHDGDEVALIPPVSGG